MTIRGVLFCAILFVAWVGDAFAASEYTFDFESVSSDAPISVPTGQDGVDIVVYFATWCPYCKALMPHLQSIKDQYGDQVRIFAISIREDGDANGYILERGYQFDLMLEGEAVAEQHGVKGTPAVYAFDKEQKLVFNLYDHFPKAMADLKDKSHFERSQRMAPWWAARLRESIAATIE